MQKLGKFILCGATIGMSLMAFGQAATGEVIIKFKPGISTFAKNAVLANVTVVRQADILGSMLVKPKNLSQTAKQLETQLDSNPNIQYADQNWIMQAFDIPNDPRYIDQWHLPQINAPAAWDLQKGTTDVIIAVIDTGCDYLHPDLAAKLLPGRDIINNDNDPQDDQGHGTHCAGIAAGITNNSVGIAGMARNNFVLPIKVLGADGSGPTDGTNQGILWAADHGAKIISLSLGSAGSSGAGQAAVDYAIGKGCVVVCAAGNNGDTAKHWPAAYTGSLAVASSDPDDSKSDFSTYGSDWVHVAAPGNNILSCELSGGYIFESGTSMACPLVAGLAALVASQAGVATNPTLIKGYITSTCAPTTGIGGKPNPYVIFGRVNAFAAVNAVPITVTDSYGPTALTVSYGTVLGGNVGSLQNQNDNLLLTIESQTVRSTMQYVGADLTFVASSTTLNKLRGIKVSFDVSTTGTPVAGYTQAWNFQTNAWVQMNSFTGRQAPAPVTVTLPGTGSAYINGSKQIKIRILMQTQTTRAGVGGSKYQLRVDYARADVKQLM